MSVTVNTEHRKNIIAKAAVMRCGDNTVADGGGREESGAT